jgi:hypothetical protein
MPGAGTCDDNDRVVTVDDPILPAASHIASLQPTA